MLHLCAICGKTEKETRIIHSVKYGMDLCKYHHEKLSRQHKQTSNNLIDNKLVVDKYTFTIDNVDLPIINNYKWSVKLIDNTPYLINSEGHYLLNIILKTSNYKLVKFIDNNPLNYIRKNLYIYIPKQFKKIKTSRFGYKGVYKSCIYPVEYRYEFKLNGKRISSKGFKRIELAIYLFYLVNMVILDNNLMDDEYIKQAISKLTIVDKENIEKYFIAKYLPLNPKYKTKWRIFKKDISFNNRVNKNIFYREI